MKIHFLTLTMTTGIGEPIYVRANCITAVYRRYHGSKEEWTDVELGAQTYIVKETPDEIFTLLRNIPE